MNKKNYIISLSVQNYNTNREKDIRDLLENSYLFEHVSVHLRGKNHAPIIICGAMVVLPYHKSTKKYAKSLYDDVCRHSGSVPVMDILFTGVEDVETTEFINYRFNGSREDDE